MAPVDIWSTGCLRLQLAPEHGAFRFTHARFFYWRVVIMGQMFMQDIRNHMMSKNRIRNHMMSKYLFEIAPSLTLPPMRSQYSTQLGGHNTYTPRETELAEHIMIVKRIG